LWSSSRNHNGKWRVFKHNFLRQLLLLLWWSDEIATANRPTQWITWCNEGGWMSARLQPSVEEKKVIWKLFRAFQKQFHNSLHSCTWCLLNFDLITRWRSSSCINTKQFSLNETKISSLKFYLPRDCCSYE
jgi:hypothetical protein